MDEKDKTYNSFKCSPLFYRQTASNMWSQPLHRLDGTKEQYDLFHPLGPHTESKRTKSPFCYILALLYCYCCGQPAHHYDYNSQQDPELTNVLFSC